LPGALPIAFGADEVSQVLDAMLIVLITALPFAFLVGLMRSSLSRASAVSALFERLGGVSARDALVEALGDDSLTLAYWLPESGRYVDARGHGVALPASGGDRAVTEIERHGAPVAAIVHDPALLEDPELVRTAGVAAALALDNERLAAELRARYDDLRAAKYASATSAEVTIQQINGDLVIEVADDGVGGADPAGGTGLLGLADRVAALGGRLDVASPRGGGTTVRAELPTGPVR